MGLNAVRRQVDGDTQFVKFVRVAVQRDRRRCEFRFADNHTAFAAPVEDGESRLLCSMTGIILVKKVTDVMLFIG